MERKSQSYHYVVLVADGDLDRTRPLGLSDDAANGVYAQTLAQPDPFGTGARIDAFIGLSHQNIG